jgi:hypothetical protein
MSALEVARERVPETPYSRGLTLWSVAAVWGQQAVKMSAENRLPVVGSDLGFARRSGPLPTIEQELIGVFKCLGFVPQFFCLRK